MVLLGLKGPNRGGGCACDCPYAPEGPKCARKSHTNTHCISDAFQTTFGSSLCHFAPSWLPLTANLASFWLLLAAPWPAKCFLKGVLLPSAASKPFFGRFCCYLDVPNIIKYAQKTILSMFFAYSASGPAARFVIYFSLLLACFSLHFAPCRPPFSDIFASKMHAEINIKFQCDFCAVFVPLGRLWASHWHSQGRQHGSKMDFISPSKASFMAIPSKSTRDPPQDHPRASQNTPQTLILAKILTLF